MLYFLEATGSIVRVVPERVYQGSNEGNKIMLVAPFASSCMVEVVFKLANGQTTDAYPLQYIGKMQEDNKGCNYAMHAWQTILPIAVTEYYGEVEVQFFCSTNQKEKIATEISSFIVERGLMQSLPEQPSVDVYTQLKEMIATMQADLTNAVYSARAIYAWNSTYSYNANEITFFPYGKFGAFVQSIQPNNQNIPIVDGVVDGAWRVLVSFDNIADSYFEALQNIAKEAKAELLRIQNIIDTLNTVSNSVLICVDTLPQIGEKNTIYAVLSTNNNQLFALYVWADKWIFLGEKGIESLTQVPEGAVLYLPQKLTTEQQLQARENIGAQGKGEYLEQEQLTAQLKDFATIDGMQNALTNQEVTLQNAFSTQIEDVQSSIARQIEEQQALVLAIESQLLQMQTTLSNQIEDINEAIAKLQENTTGGGGGTALTGNVGGVAQPVYVENGVIKACENLRAETHSIQFVTDNSLCPANLATRNVIIGTNLSVLNAGIDSILIGNRIIALGDNLLSLGSGEINGEYLLALGLETFVKGEYSSAIGIMATATGEMACSIGSCANNNEDFSIVIGSEENKNVYYYGALQAKSDMRDKADIEDLDNKKSLQFINALRTVSYVNNDRRKYRDKRKKITDNSVGEYDKIAHAKGEKKGNRRQVGVLAQDVELKMQKIYQKEVANLVNDSLYKAGGEGIKEGVESQKFVNYIAFVPFLISAMQEQQREIQALKKQLKSIKKESV